MAAKKKMYCACTSTLHFTHETHSSPSPSRRFRFNEVLFFVRVTPPPMTNERTNERFLFFFSFWVVGVGVLLLLLLGEFVKALFFGVL